MLCCSSICTELNVTEKFVTQRIIYNFEILEFFVVVKFISTGSFLWSSKKKLLKTEKPKNVTNFRVTLFIRWKCENYEDDFLQLPTVRNSFTDPSFSASQKTNYFLRKFLSTHYKKISKLPWNFSLFSTFWFSSSRLWLMC